jgi:hypothetical protein
MKTVPLYWGEGPDRILVGSAEVNTETGVVTMVVEDPELVSILTDDLILQWPPA